MRMFSLPFVCSTHGLPEHAPRATGALPSKCPKGGDPVHWERVAVKGSHWQFKHPTKQGRVTVPHPVKDIKAGTVMSIYRQAGWR